MRPGAGIAAAKAADVLGRRQGARRLGDTRGNVQTEYLVVLWGVCIVGAVAVIGVGLPLLELFQLTQAVLVMPVP